MADLLLITEAAEVLLTSEPPEIPLTSETAEILLTSGEAEFLSTSEAVFFFLALTGLLKAGARLEVWHRVKKNNVTAKEDSQVNVKGK